MKKYLIVGLFITFNSYCMEVKENCTEQIIEQASNLILNYGNKYGFSTSTKDVSLILSCNRDVITFYSPNQPREYSKESSLPRSQSASAALFTNLVFLHFNNEKKNVDVGPSNAITFIPNADVQSIHGRIQLRSPLKWSSPKILAVQLVKKSAESHTITRAKKSKSFSIFTYLLKNRRTLTKRYTM